VLEHRVYLCSVGLSNWAQMGSYQVVIVIKVHRVTFVVWDYVD
jgi:hypothetical protein